MVDSHSRYDPFSRWRFYVVYVNDQICGSMWNRAGPTRGKWGILDGKVESGLILYSELQCDSPCMCQLRTVSVVPCCNKHWVVYWRICDLWGSQKLSNLTVIELDDTLPRFTGVHWDSVRATHGLPVEVFTWKTTLGWGRTRPDSFVVNANDGHSWYLCGSRVSCCQVIFLVRWLLIRISMTPSDIGEACSLCTNVEVLFHFVHMRFMVMFNYDYLVDENDDTKNGWLIYLACLAYVANLLLLLINLTWLITWLKLISSRC
jgi:hypothetical protein